jgi:hypothetical protein
VNAYSEGLMCPSAPAELDNLLIGIVQNSGRVALLGKAWPVSPGFLANAAGNLVAPELRFRFAGKCQSSGCANWRSGRCGVVDKVMPLAAASEPSDVHILPDCSLRPGCRWFRQNGGRACIACQWVITEPVVISKGLDG